MKTALILVDIQNDFLPGGALAVPQADQVVPIANQLIPQFELVVATQDWHPINHGSFAANHPGRQPGQRIDLNGLPQILWPVHCVQQTRGAAFPPNLNLNQINKIFRKGTNPAIDSYSALFDNGHRQSTGLGEYLTNQLITDVCIMGLATDYCVKFTALDCVDAGFKVHLIIDACRGVELNAGDIENALTQMQRQGFLVVTSTNQNRTVTPPTHS